MCLAISSQQDLQSNSNDSEFEGNANQSTVDSGLSDGSGFIAALLCNFRSENLNNLFYFHTEISVANTKKSPKLYLKKPSLVLCILAGAAESQDQMWHIVSRHILLR